jgi:Patched family
MNWLNDESGFPLFPRTMVLLFHEDGNDNVLSKDFVRQSFLVLDSVVTLPDYTSVCAFYDPNATCDVSGFLKFWNNSLSIFDATVTTDQDVLMALAQDEFPDRTPVSRDAIVGNIMLRQEANNATAIAGAQSFMVIISLPEDRDGNTASADFEKKALEAVFNVQERLEQGSTFRVETIADRSFTDEFGRAIINDIPLVAVVFVVMSIFTCAIFFKKNRIQARSTLGFMAVLSILLSILAGYGFMFVCGVPFSTILCCGMFLYVMHSTNYYLSTASMTQILPFVFFGVGLDDAFIITGSYYRMDPQRTVVDRMEETMDEIGLSIFLTTLTSCLAFGLGCLSSIPAVFWLCIYATPTMAFILLWQLTFFIGCMAIDERRVAARKGDGIRRFLHCSKPSSEETAEKEATEPKESIIDRFMVQFAHVILMTWMKVVIIVAFLALAAACAFSTSTLRQGFKFTDVLPGDSYITTFFEAQDDYTRGSSVFPAVYFRNEDQSDPLIRAQMEAFLNEIVEEVAAVGKKQPDFCWFRDFDVFVAKQGLDDQLFSEQLRAFLADDVYNHLYQDNIVLDDQGSIVTSRCMFPMDSIDFEDVKMQINTLNEQLQVTERQLINQGKAEFSFFTYEGSK